MVTSDKPMRPGAAEATDQYGRVFVLLLAILSFAMFLDESRPVRVLVGLAVIVVVMWTLRAAGVANRTMRYALMASVGLGALVTTGGFTDAKVVAVAVSIAAAGALTVALLALVRRIFEQPRIGPREVVAALAAYVQIAFVFAFLFSGAAVLTDGAFFNNGIAGQASDFFYFSVVTITTLGYGDLSPATSMGRSLVMIEALVGQIFLIVLVAYLVGMLGHSRTSARRDS